MLLFTPDLAALVLSRRKTQTRRMRAARPCVPGSTHQCYTRPPWMQGRPFAEIAVGEVRRERVADISEADAVAEGFASRAAFLTAIVRLYGEAAVDAECWVVAFVLHRVT